MSGWQTRNEESRYRRLKGIVEDGKAVAALDAIYTDRDRLVTQTRP